MYLAGHQSEFQKCTQRVNKVEQDQNQRMLTLEQIKQRSGGLVVLRWPRAPLTSLSHTSFGGCISGDMTPPTRLRTPWLEFVIREAWSSARWSIHITTFLSGSPGRAHISKIKNIHNILFAQCTEKFPNANLQPFFISASTEHCALQQTETSDLAVEEGICTFTGQYSIQLH